jgi:hypothetical protein
MIRYFVLRPAALVLVVVGLGVIIAALVLLPSYLPTIPLLNQLRGQSAPQATEDYLRGNRDYDADLVWASLSDDARARLRNQGASQDDLRRQMESAKQQGIKLEDVQYIGSKAMPDGTSFQFYLVGVRQAAKADIDYQPFMFTLDRDGKIAKVQ